MKNKIYIAIICAFSIVFAISSGFLIKHYYDSAKQAEMYDNLIEVVETEPKETKEPMNYSEEKTFIPEYQELYLQNNDMVGWIKVEDTKINYPVMQSKDNPNFYLKHGGVIQRVRALARKEHRLDRALVERTDVDVQSTADRRDFLDLALVVRHDGRRAAGQHDVGAVVHRDIVRDVVDEGALASHVFEHFLKHICFSFLNKKQEAPTTGVSCKKP